jgi:hypothetical protein
MKIDLYLNQMIDYYGLENQKFIFENLKYCPECKKELPNSFSYSLCRCASRLRFKLGKNHLSFNRLLKLNSVSYCLDFIIKSEEALYLSPMRGGAILKVSTYVIDRDSFLKKSSVELSAILEKILLLY